MNTKLLSLDTLVYYFGWCLVVVSIAAISSRPGYAFVRTCSQTGLCNGCGVPVDTSSPPDGILDECKTGDPPSTPGVCATDPPNCDLCTGSCFVAPGGQECHCATHVQ